MGFDAARGFGRREDWQAVALAVNARMAARRVGQQELANRSGVSVATLRALQRGSGDRRIQDATLGAVSRALGWLVGHLLAVLTGETPAADDTDTGVEDLDAQAEILAILRRIERHVETLARGHTPA